MKVGKKRGICRWPPCLESVRGWRVSGWREYNSSPVGMEGWGWDEDDGDCEKRSYVSCGRGCLKVGTCSIYEGDG